MDKQLITEALQNSGYIIGKYFDAPIIQQKDFNHVYFPNKYEYIFDNLTFQTDQAIRTGIDQHGNLTIWHEMGATKVTRSGKDSFLMQKIYPELKDRGISIEELYKQFYLIEESNKFTDEEKSVLIQRNYTDETQIIQYKVNNYVNGYVKEIYLIKDLGQFYKHHHVVVFMKDNNRYIHDSAFYSQQDVVMVIEPLDGSYDMAEEIIQSIRVV